MAVVVSVKAGGDVSYPFRQMGSAEAGTHLGKRGTGYYLAAAERGGEPQGTWIGEGISDLGIHDGDVVDRKAFETIYGEFKDPFTGESLGAPPRVNAELRRIFDDKKAAEPGLTRERERELWIEARAEVKSAGNQYYDATFSPDKTVALAHSSAMAAAFAAKEAGDLDKAAMWETRAASIWDEIERSARVFVDYIQDEARFVRTGHHGRRVEGADQGKYEDSAEIPVAMFPHHCNRNGEPHLHIHLLFLNKVRTISDGIWRGADGRSIFRARGSGSAIGVDDHEIER